MFWLVSLLAAISIFGPILAFDHSKIEDQLLANELKSLSAIEINTVSVLDIKRSRTEFVLQTPSGKKKYYNIKFHRLLQQHFPDWKERMDFQRNQEKFYKLAIKKKEELARTRTSDKKSYYTKEELDAMDYFHGTGVYQKYQNPEVKPNILDTRESFLIKMHDDVLRTNFLNSFNKNKNY